MMEENNATFPFETSDGTCKLLFQNETVIEDCPYGVDYKPSYPDENSAVTEVRQYLPFSHYFFFSNIRNT